MKRTNPFADELPVQCKFHVAQKDVDRSSTKRMAAVHAKTLKMLFSASNQAQNSAVAGRDLERDSCLQNPTATLINGQFPKCCSCFKPCPVMTAATCNFCDRSSCDACSRTCVACERNFCPLCSMLRYNQYGEHATCLSCNRS
ncbi:apoptosis regulatory protein Siva [Ixodes scapularis]|uniref:apoptosis regulatory protein Siva n=1 Tax=Ixodes scapularis TaxID=6945 RepID=UPI001161A7D0|nr:apoptosis regulatory protein Siva [Ixodes scapularis]